VNARRVVEQAYVRKIEEMLSLLEKYSNRPTTLVVPDDPRQKNALLIALRSSLPWNFRINEGPWRNSR
jgi:hypothetical protein